VKRALLVLVACGGPDFPQPQTPLAVVPALDAPMVSVLADAPVPDVAPVTDAPIDAPIDTPPPADPEVWLRGSTHVHARPSGDSSEPIPKVIRWYEDHHYDFIVLTDHNQVSEIDPTNDTHARVAVSAPAHGLIVIAGTELTHNPSGCLPPGDKSKKCRIHVNVLGVTARPLGKIEWADRKTHLRIEKYEAALVEAKVLGGLVQINHPQWFWGMTADLLIELAKRGVRLVEIANSQFAKWNAGDKDHLSTEALWDAALDAGQTIWGVASDDAHDYEGKHGKYPAGGAWIVVKARRDPQAILDAISAGHFYASNGVVLERAEVAAGELVVEVAASDPGEHTIAFVEHGKIVQTVKGRSARRTVPATGYVRAVVSRGDARAWVQPARR
jgi:hypothetical protein